MAITQKIIMPKQQQRPYLFGAMVERIAPYGSDYRLISDASTWGSKPSVMSESERSRFMGIIMLRNACTLINNAVLETAV